MTKSSPTIWHLLHNVKSTVKISAIFVAFLENTNFTIIDTKMLSIPLFFRIKDKNYGQKNYLFSRFSMNTCQILKTKEKSILLGMIQEIELFILCFVAPCNLLVVGKILWIRGFVLSIRLTFMHYVPLVLKN